ncbi:hypothetical protein ACF073_40880 [Streptomyces sp. NPDC015171]|uniref:hypothetical protein n=1 Tax=Streptomyces sp. NPDC015171 TaxID=3364945 RepID=UPI0036F9E51E
MRNFFEDVTRVWPAGRRDLHWHILPTADESEALLNAYPEAAFSRPGLCRVSARWLHCTLLHALDVSTSSVNVDALTDDARVAIASASIAPFMLTFDRPAIGAAAVEISGWPGRPFTELVTILTKITQAHAPFRPAVSRYPHMSIAYTGAGADSVQAVDLREALAHIDGPLVHTVYASRVHLVEQWHDNATITWRPIAFLPLDGTA